MDTHQVCLTSQGVGGRVSWGGFASSAPVATHSRSPPSGYLLPVACATALRGDREERCTAGG
jgi:hypothetical protein